MSSYNAAVDLVGRNDPDRLAIIDDDGRYTYGEVAERVANAAGAFRGARRAARATRRAVHARRHRSRRELPRRDPHGRGPRAAQHAADARRLPLPDRRLARAS
jgi:acyl-CoA synthetase (AMP-forming)/AMP-acid ligase II